MFFVATFLVILVTLECHGEQNTHDDGSSWTQITQAPTTLDPQVLRYPARDSHSHRVVIISQRVHGTQNQATRRTNAPDQGVRGHSCNCNRNREEFSSTQQLSAYTPTEATIQNSSETVPDHADAINNQLRQFGLNLLIQLSEADKTSNLILSPFSIWTLLLVVLEGADGSTAEQIRQTLHLPRDPSKIRSNYKLIEGGLVAARGSADVETLSSLFFDVHRPIIPDYENVAQHAYHAEVHPVNFSNPIGTARQINQWVANKTHNRITHLVSSGDLVQPHLVVTNAIYFKGLWEMPFNSTATKKDKFYNEENVHIANVDMMYQKGVYLYSFIREINALVLDMPYVNYKFRMLIVLPQQGNTLLNVYRAMKRFPVNQCYDRLVEEQALYVDSEVPVYIPRFKVKNERNLNRFLKNLGIEDVFDENHANLTRMTAYKTYLTKMVHVAEIEVTEKGTTASGATAGMFGNKQAPPKFVANRPFAFFIVEDSRKTVIFAGRVMNPASSN